jgi:hypothetical protein
VTEAPGVAVIMYGVCEGILMEGKSSVGDSVGFGELVGSGIGAGLHAGKNNEKPKIKIIRKEDERLICDILY